MSLNVEYNHQFYFTNAGKKLAIDDFINGVHLRIEGHQNGGYFGASNAMPEGEKNGYNYRQLGFYVKTNPNETIKTVENFMGRENLFEIKITSTNQKTKRTKP